MIDTHTHIYDEQFDDDREAVIGRAGEAGVESFLLPAVDRESYEALFALALRHPENCLPMMGLHPTSVNENPRYRDDLQLVARYLANPPEGIRFYGIGEVGLDLYWNREYLAQQQDALRFQIGLALEYDLPLVIHTRDAWEEMCGLLEEYQGRGLRGVMHSFCGTAEHYRRIGKCGDFLFGIGGPVTYKKSTVAPVIEAMALDHLLLETDAPYLPPVPFRGKRNEPAYLPYIRDRIAQIKGLSPEQVAAQTTANARRMFRI